ncbi:MAG: beta-galactosidase [Eubacteriales bacterium]|nr:beta-galactosidase [Eubacteriales bacterium]
MAQYPPIMKGMPVLLHGGDYNPEQWLKQKDTIWKEDMAFAKKAGINTLSIGIFSWAHLEPQEGCYTFEWMDEVMDMLHANGIKAILATPSGARPPWLAEKYPEVLRVNNLRQKMLYGGRHNHCLSSPVYREKVAQINEKLAQRYGKHPALGMWHISNEYGGECHCPLCQQEFQDWLKDRYGTIEALNEAWWNQFWAHRYNNFRQIESPTSPDWLGENENHGLKLSWRRFTSWHHCDFYVHEIEPLKRITPEIPCTTNLMSTYPAIDYFALGRLLDRSSWDNYPAWTGTEADAEVCTDTAFKHDLMRGVGDNKPFMMMESSPSAVNWQPINGLRRPGTILLQGLQAVAHGSDTVQYFQFRKSRGNFEKFHGALIDHTGRSDTRVFQEVCAVGEALKTIASVAGSSAENKVALLYDWENRWALDDARFVTPQKGYEQTVIAHHSALMAAGLGVDVVDETCALNGYRLVVAPMCYMLRNGFPDQVKTFVGAGGTLVLTYISGYVNQDDLCFLDGFPGPLREVAGVWAEEVDARPPQLTNSFAYEGKTYLCREYFELIHAQTAEVLSVYQSDFYAGMPVVTKNEYGKGCCYYVAARTGTDFLTALYRTLTREQGLEPIVPGLPQGAGATLRVGADGLEYRFVMNYLPEETRVNVGPPQRDLLTCHTVAGETVIPPRGVLVLVKE